jgi:hypothetical protein
MPRGFAGETSEQEARGPGRGGSGSNISASDIDRGREESSLREEARALRNAASPINDPRQAINALVNQYTAQFGPLSRGAYNSFYGRNIQNPGGIDTLGYGIANVLGKISPTLFGGGVKSNVPQLSGTVFSKKAPGGGTLIKSGNTMMGMSADEYYGRSPRTRSDLETYEDKYGYKTPQERALQRGYDQYMNPYNEPGKPGYNRDAPTMRPVTDEVRPGLRSTMFTDRSGQPTALGPLSTMDTDYSGIDRAVMAAAPLTLGGLMHQLTGKKTVIGNVPSMDAMLPTPEMLEQGQTYGGFTRQIGAGYSDVMDGIGRFFSGNQPARKPAPNLTQAELDENMYGTGMIDLENEQYGATVPRSSIQRNATVGAPVPESSINVNPRMSVDDRLDLLEALQADINRRPQRSPQDVFLDVTPGAIQLADASRNTYRSKYQGQPGLFNPGGKGQTYYGGQQDNSIFNFDDATQRAEEAFNNMINYFRT